MKKTLYVNPFFFLFYFFFFVSFFFFYHTFSAKLTIINLFFQKKGLKHTLNLIRTDKKWET